MVPTKRDYQILTDIQELGDGILARRHLRERYFRDVSRRAMQKVMQRLFENRYIKRATIQYRTAPNRLQEPVYWLDYRGILHLAEHMNIEDLYYPKNEGENQMRRLESHLREQGIRWLRKAPVPGKLKHHFMVVDFRMKVERDIAELPSLTLEWINESKFRSPEMDRVIFSVQDEDGRVVETDQGICPDGCCIIRDNDRRGRGEPYKLHLLLEMDMGTHPVESRFVNAKAVPYAAYISSPAFRARFDAKTGDWLVVTSGKKRMDNLIRKSHEKVGQGMRWFLFTTSERALTARHNVFTTPIWYKAGSDQPIALLS